MNERVNLHVFHRTFVVEKELLAFLQACSLTTRHAALDRLQMTGLAGEIMDGSRIGFLVHTLDDAEETSFGRVCRIPFVIDPQSVSLCPF